MNLSMSKFLMKPRVFEKPFRKFFNVIIKSEFNVYNIQIVSSLPVSKIFLSKENLAFQVLLPRCPQWFRMNGSYGIKQLLLLYLYSRCFVLMNLVFNEFLVILNKFWTMQMLIQNCGSKTPLLTNSSLHLTKIMVSSTNFILDLVNSIILLSFRFCLYLLNHLKLSNF